MPGRFLRAFWNGNAAVGAAVKAPMGAKSTLKKLDGMAGLGELRTAITAYENIAPANDPTCALRMTALATVDAQIYRWFNATRVPKMADVKGAKEMAKLLKKAEQAHEQLVDAIKDDANIVPFDTTGLTPAEVTARQAVWRGVVDGTAQVKLGGSEKFQKKTRAQMVKMLQTDTGAKVLEYLSATHGAATAATDRIIVSDELPAELANVPHLQAAKQEVSLALQLVDNSARYELPPPVDAAGDEDPAEFPTLNQTADLQAAIFAGARGVIVAGKKYTFAPGMGAIVKTVAPRGGDEDSDIAGEGGTEVITPAFITLAHELGHAMNIRAGASARNAQDLMYELCKAADPTLTDQQIELIWTNGEEYFNINNIDNALRRECGVPVRAAHKSRAGLVKFQQAEDMARELNTLRAREEAVGSLPEFADWQQYNHTNKKNIDDPVIFAQLSKKVERVRAAATDDKLRTLKRNELRAAKAQLDAAYDAKAAVLPGDSPLRAQYQAVTTQLRDNMDTLIAIGTNTFTQTKDTMRNLRFALNAVPAGA